MCIICSASTGSVSAIFASSPPHPPTWSATVAKMTIAATRITTACIASVRATDRKPPAEV